MAEAQANEGDEKISKTGCLMELLLIGLFLLVAARIFGWELPTVPELCGNEIRSEFYSPDQQLKAVVFVRNCGATTSYSTHVSVLRSGEKLPNDPGSVFSCLYVPRVRPRWVADQKLRIEYGHETMRNAHQTVAGPLPVETYVVPSPAFSFQKEETVLIEFKEVPENDIGKKRR